MIKKTEAIVLRTLKHQDANLITTLYTREFGIRSFIIRGYRSTRAKGRHSYFQPLSILHILFSHREGRDLQKITESRVQYLLKEAQTQPIKLSIGLAMMEIFYDTVKEEEQNLPLYSFLENIIIRLDQSERKLIHLFLFFLVHLTAYLGFFPNDQSEAAARVRFQLKKGTFSATTDQNDPVADLFRRFLHSQLENCQEIHVDSMLKRHLIRLLFEYYDTHIEGFRYPQTLRVFSEVFGGIE